MMKNILFNILILSFLSSCIYIKRDNEEVFKQQRERARLDSLYLLYDSMPPRFDIKDFHENRKAHLYYGEFYYNVYEDSILTKYRKIRNEYVKEIAYQNSVLVERAFYDSTGIIRKKLHTFNPTTYIPYGKVFEYNKDGKLINVIERFPSFTFTFDDLVQVLDSMEIYKDYFSWNVAINPENNKSYWKIQSDLYPKRELFYFDTETGELFERIP